MMNSFATRFKGWAFHERIASRLHGHPRFRGDSQLEQLHVLRRCGHVSDACVCASHALMSWTICVVRSLRRACCSDHSSLPVSSVCVALGRCCPGTAFGRAPWDALLQCSSQCVTFCSLS